MIDGGGRHHRAGHGRAGAFRQGASRRVDPVKGDRRPL